MRLKFVATLCLAATAVVAPLAAQTKVALVDFQTALLATAEMQAEASKLEVEFQPRRDELQQLTADMQAVQERLNAATDAQAQARIQAEGARLQRQFERKREDMQADVDFRRDGILQKGAARMNEVLEKLRVERGIDAIIDTSAVYVFSATLDVTSAATAAYDAAYPAAAN